MSGVPMSSFEKWIVPYAKNKFKEYGDAEISAEEIAKGMEDAYHAGQLQVINELREIIEKAPEFRPYMSSSEVFIMRSELLQKLSDLSNAINGKEEGR